MYTYMNIYCTTGVNYKYKSSYYIFYICADGDMVIGDVFFCYELFIIIMFVDILFYTYPYIDIVVVYIHTLVVIL